MFDYNQSYRSLNLLSLSNKSHKELFISCLWILVQLTLTNKTFLFILLIFNFDATLAPRLAGIEHYRVWFRLLRNLKILCMQHFISLFIRNLLVKLQNLSQIVFENQIFILNLTFLKLNLLLKELDVTNLRSIFSIRAGE